MAKDQINEVCHARPELLRRIAKHPGAQIVVVDQEGVSSYSGGRIHDDTLGVMDHLRDLGLHAGCRVGIRAQNSYEWLILDFALITLGCTSVCIPVGNPELDPLSGSALAEQYNLSFLFQENGFDAGDCDVVSNVSDLIRLAHLRPPCAFGNAAPGAAVVSDVFTIVFSSGTTGRLKRLPISWDSLQHGIEAVSDAFEINSDDRIFDILPLSIFQQRYLAYCALYRGATVVLSTQDQFFEALKAGNPTVILGPPAFYEVAEQRFDRWSGRKRDALTRISNLLRWAPRPLRQSVRKRLFQSLHDIYGSAVRLMLVGSAPINHSTLTFFERAGFPLYQIYGMTECGWIAWNRPGANKLGSVGKPAFPGAISLGPEGEVLVRNPKHLCHYYEGADAAENAPVFLDEQTISTGDIGAFDKDGFLFLRGRKKNVIITAGGQKISPENIEDKVKAVGKIDHVVVFHDDGLRALSAVIWPTDQGDEARAAIARDIKGLNRQILSTTPIMGLVFSDIPLSADTGLLTRNLKVDRAAAQERLGPSVERIGTFG